MIEKLDIIKDSENCVDAFGYTHNVAGNKVINKINELCDAVNELQKHEEQHLDLLTQLNEMRLHQNKEPADRMIGCTTLDIPESYNELHKATENVQDKFAEQRKWIGKLCKFWTFRRENTIIGLLTDFEIDEPHFRMDGLGWYEHCEPVKPDDDIIYQGGDNE